MLGRTERAVPIPKESGYYSTLRTVKTSTTTGDGQVLESITVKISNSNLPRKPSGLKTYRRQKSSVTFSQQDGAICEDICDGEILNPIVIEVTDGRRERHRPSINGDVNSKRAVAVACKNRHGSFTQSMDRQILYPVPVEVADRRRWASEGRVPALRFRAG